jgi:hypothetical protein
VKGCHCSEGIAKVDDTPEKIRITLSRQEALVLFDYLRRCDEEGQYSFADPAEQRVLWNLEGAIEKSLLEVFDPEYCELLRKAWAALRDEDLFN